MAGFVTRGQPAAIRQVSAMIAAGLPHALLLVGPRSVGKTTLALDIAAAQLCLAAEVADRPCRACRGCRLVADGNHLDLHRRAPDGPGGVVGIDGIRGLIGELSLLPIEGGARVAIVEGAHRMTEDAQNALLKTLEEPPSGVTIILCAEDEERLLPTIHSRVARVRVGTLAPREIEALLGERGEADAPTANRLARLVGGRPGLAVAYANAPDAAAIRGEMARSVLDLVDVPRAMRLVRARELLGRAADLLAALTPAPSEEAAVSVRLPRRRAGKGGAAGRGGVAARAADARPAVGDGPSAGEGSSPGDGPPAGEGSSVGDATSVEGSAASESAAVSGAAPGSVAGRAAPAERRRAAAALLDIWRETARDLALVALGEVGAVHEPDLLEELGATAARLPRDGVIRFLDRLDRAGQLLDANANPELTVDVLALAWPRPERVA